MNLRLGYPQTIERRLKADQLALLDEAEADTGEEDRLQGNQQYRDLRFADWPLVERAISAERALFARFEAATNLDQEADIYDEERFEALDPEEDWWGLDVGVIGAVLALSALGAVTVSSCNAGGFGGRHVEPFPLVVFFLPQSAVAEVLAIAEEADVGLDTTQGGLVQLYGRTDYDLHRFGEAAWARHLRSAARPA